MNILENDPNLSIDIPESSIGCDSHTEHRSSLLILTTAVIIIVRFRLCPTNDCLPLSFLGLASAFFLSLLLPPPSHHFLHETTVRVTNNPSVDSPQSAFSITESSIQH